MNNSNAAAKRRRAGIQPTTPPMPTQNTSEQQSQSTMAQQQGFTLPQVIALIDNRLIALENFMKETKESTELSIPEYNGGDVTTSAVDNGAVFMDSKEFTDFVDDVNQRFQLFADEINGLKEIVLKLQGFTMDVNKMLLATISKQGEPVPNITFEMNSNEVAPEEQTFVLNDMEAYEGGSIIGGILQKTTMESSAKLESQSETVEQPDKVVPGKSKKR